MGVVLSARVFFISMGVGVWVIVLVGFGSLSVCASALMRDVSGVTVAIVAAVSIVVRRLDMVAYVT